MGLRGLICVISRVLGVKKFGMQIWSTLDLQQSGIKLELPGTNERLMMSPTFTAIQLLENELSISLSEKTGFSHCHYSNKSPVRGQSCLYVS